MNVRELFDLIGSPPKTDARTRLQWAAGIVNKVRSGKLPPDVLTVLGQHVIGWMDLCTQTDWKAYKGFVAIIADTREAMDRRDR